MIPVKPQLEPQEFDQLVRTPGIRFLKKLSGSKPTTKQWASNDHWKEIRTQLYEAYNGVCAYNAHWIPRGSSVPNVDHFIPKSVQPQLAYEWNNYRLASDLANKLKGNWQDVLDPFSIMDDWFFLKFPSLLVYPNPKLASELQQQILATIKRLQLNEEYAIVEERNTWLEMYCKSREFSLLKKFAPFIARELVRQNLVDKIISIMNYNDEHKIIYDF